MPTHWQACELGPGSRLFALTPKTNWFVTKLETAPKRLVQATCAGGTG